MGKGAQDTWRRPRLYGGRLDKTGATIELLNRRRLCGYEILMDLPNTSMWREAPRQLASAAQIVPSTVSVTDMQERITVPVVGHGSRGSRAAFTILRCRPKLNSAYAPARGCPRASEHRFAESDARRCWASRLATCGWAWGSVVWRQDYAYPFRIDAASHQAAQSGYADHVSQMIRQVLLTDPGERVCLPEFGCGLRRLLFAPHSDALQATTKLIVMQALSRWLAGQIEVKDVTVSRPGQSLDARAGEAMSAPDGVMQVRIEYVRIETREKLTATVEVK